MAQVDSNYEKIGGRKSRWTVPLNKHLKEENFKDFKTMKKNFLKECLRLTFNSADNFL